MWKQSAFLLEVASSNISHLAFPWICKFSINIECFLKVSQVDCGSNPQPGQPETLWEFTEVPKVHLEGGLEEEDLA